MSAVAGGGFARGGSGIEVGFPKSTLFARQKTSGLKTPFDSLKTTLSLLACFLGLLSSAKGQTTTATQGDPNERILNIEMRLSAYGLESDHIPNIDAILDFDQDTSLFVKLFFRPDYPNATYRLTPAAMDSILALLRLEDLEIHYRIFVSSHIGIDDLSLNDALIDWFVLHNDHSFVIFDACSL